MGDLIWCQANGNYDRKLNDKDVKNVFTFLMDNSMVHLDNAEFAFDKSTGKLDLIKHKSDLSSLDELLVYIFNGAIESLFTNKYDPTIMIMIHCMQAMCCNNIIISDAEFDMESDDE